MRFNYFMMSCISSCHIISVVCFADSERLPIPIIFYWAATSVSDAAADNPNGTKTLLANSLSIFAIKGKPFFTNSRRRYLEILLVLPCQTNEFYISWWTICKTLQTLETCVLNNNSLCWKIILNIRITNYVW